MESDSLKNPIDLPGYQGKCALPLLVENISVKQRSAFSPLAQAVEEFRGQMDELIENKDSSTVILCEDEGIFSSEPISTATWTKIGEQCIVNTRGGTREHMVVFGAVNPESGDLLEQISESGNTESFKAFLKYDIEP